jgi:hypothetical protein
MNVRVARGAGGVEGVVWGAVKVMGTAQEAAEVDEAGDGGAVQGRAVGPSGVGVGPPTPILWVVRPPGLTVGLPTPILQAV